MVGILQAGLSFFHMLPQFGEISLNGVHDRFKVELQRFWVVSAESFADPA
jgi:hypothetical protein